MTELSPTPAPPVTYATPEVSPNDRSHLQVLAICHWVWGGLQLLFGCLPIIHVVMGILILNGQFFPQPTGPGAQNASPPAAMGWVFIGMGSVMILLLWTLGLLTIWSGFKLARRRRWTFSLVVAALECLQFPLGTTLGVFTIVVLCRPSVKRIYEQQA